MSSLVRVPVETRRLLREFGDAPQRIRLVDVLVVDKTFLRLGDFRFQRDHRVGLLVGVRDAGLLQ